MDVPQSSFDQLHPGIQRWIWKRGWKTLRPIQDAACPVILSGDKDVILSANTAGGKTEAAFLPIATHLASRQDALCVCISPLKALINDQFDRLVELCGAAEVPVCKWHGDVDAGKKKKFMSSPRGVLIITPESLEAQFVRRGTQVRSLFGHASHVVIDEFHTFIGTDRGKQLQSLLQRLELIARAHIPRIALSATLGDLEMAAAYLRPGRTEAPVFIADEGEKQTKLLLKGCEYTPMRLASDAATTSESARGETDESDTEELSGGTWEIARHLFRTLRGSSNLVFANARSRVEQYADVLRRMSEAERVPNEFLPHHGSLSKELREHAEHVLKTKTATIIATTTLEMGIDVGDVQSIAQVGVPPSVASLKQRLGRSGRADDAASILRIYIQEDEVHARSTAEDRLRCQTFQATAMLELMIEGWVEPPDVEAKNFSTLIQQTVAIVAQVGGVAAKELWTTLCKSQVFALSDAALFSALLRAMGKGELLTQTSDGLLVLGLRGEQLVDHYDFYAAFFTPEEFQLVSEGRALGSLSMSKPVSEGQHLIFGGRRWFVLNVDVEAKVIAVRPSAGGAPPYFDGDGAAVHDRVRQKMKALYLTDEVPRYLDAQARTFLAQGRREFAEAALSDRQLVAHERGCQLFPWCGDKSLDTLELLFRDRDLDVVREGVSLRFLHPPEQVRDAAKHVISALPTGDELAKRVKYRIVGKYDYFLTEELQRINFASSKLNLAGASEALRSLTHELA